MKKRQVFAFCIVLIMVLGNGTLAGPDLSAAILPRLEDRTDDLVAKIDSDEVVSCEFLQLSGTRRQCFDVIVMLGQRRAAVDEVSIRSVRTKTGTKYQSADSPSSMEAVLVSGILSNAVTYDAEYVELWLKTEDQSDGLIKAHLFKWQISSTRIGVLNSLASATEIARTLKIGEYITVECQPLSLGEAYPDLGDCLLIKVRDDDFGTVGQRGG